MNNKDIRFLDGVLLVNKNILVMSDIHLGYEEYVFGKSLFIRTQLKETIEKLENVFNLLKKEGVKVKKIIILGDLKHEFGEINESEWRETVLFLDYLLEKTKKIILIKGNHDTILGPIAIKKDIEVKDYYKVGNICFLHGDQVYGNCLESDILIMGHIHPAIVIGDKYKREKFKCFLYGKWKGKEVYVLPSSMPLILGYDMNELKNFNRRNKFSIIEEKFLRDFEVIVYNEKEDKNYNFGKLKRLIKRQES